MSEVLGEEEMGSGCSWARFFWGWWKCPKLDSGDGYTTLNKLNLLNFILSKVNFMMWIVCQLKKKAKWIQWFFHKNCIKILIPHSLSYKWEFVCIMWVATCSSSKNWCMFNFTHINVLHLFQYKNHFLSTTITL